MQFEKNQSSGAIKISPSQLSTSGDLSDILVGPAVEDTEIDGVDLSAAADRLGISEDDVWRRIRNGQLLARTVRGRVLVYTTFPVTLDNGLPPIPCQKAPSARTNENIQSDQPLQAPVSTHSSITVMDDQSRSHEVALLLDHLSLAKEENREILRLTQDSMGRMSQMTDAMLQMKDDVIAAREAQLSDLRERINGQAEELRRALRAKEDLETLTRALNQSS